MKDVNLPSLIGVGAVFIDDIVLPDGQTYMGQLGGGTIHAMMGAAIWDERPGLCAYVGNDLPDYIRTRLDAHLDTRGLVKLDFPQMRAWQVFEHDGTRTEIHRVPMVAPYVAGTRPKNLLDVYRNAQAYYLLQDYDGVRAWQAAVNGLTLWEPNALMMLPENRADFRAALRECAVDLVSPNLEEARVIYGYLEPDKLVEALLEDGAQAVALRMGADGSIVADTNGKWHHISAIGVPDVKDQTGAGNTYCGGLITGLMQGKSLQEAGVMGAVAASFCIETIGVLEPARVSRGERDRRKRLLLGY